jgi:ribonuclease P protein component
MSISSKMTYSVKRNRLRRIIKEAFRTSAYRELGVDCLVVLNAKSKNSLEKDMEKYENNVLQDLLKGFQIISEKCRLSSPLGT